MVRGWVCGATSRYFDAATVCTVEVELLKAINTAGPYAYNLYFAAKKTSFLELFIGVFSRMQFLQNMNDTLSEFLANSAILQYAKTEEILDIKNKGGVS